MLWVLDHGVGGCGSASGGFTRPRGARPGIAAAITTAARGPRVKAPPHEPSAPAYAANRARGPPGGNRQRESLTVSALLGRLETPTLCRNRNQ